MGFFSLLDPSKIREKGTVGNTLLKVTKKTSQLKRCIPIDEF